MCRNGQYTERGIKERDGYGAERYLLEPDFAIKVDPALGFLGVLLEPTSVVAKAWDHIERIGARARSWRPQRVLVTGAGPVGLLAAMIGAPAGPGDAPLRPRDTRRRSRSWCADLGATYHVRATHRAEGARTRRHGRVHRRGRGGGRRHERAWRATAVVCLAGVSSGGRSCRSMSAASIAGRCWATTWCSGRSTPTSPTTRRPPRRCQGRQGLAGAPDQPPRAAGSLARGVRATGR